MSKRTFEAFKGDSQNRFADKATDRAQAKCIACSRAYGWQAASPPGDDRATLLCDWLCSKTRLVVDLARCACGGWSGLKRIQDAEMRLP